MMLLHYIVVLTAYDIASFRCA